MSPFHCKQEMSFEFHSSSQLTSELHNWIQSEFSTHNNLYRCREGNLDEGSPDRQEIVMEVVEISNHSDQKRVGAIVGTLILHQIHIKYLIVAESYRSMGIGRRLLERFEDWARERRCDFVYVETFSYQGPDFYQKCGYQVDFIRDGFYRKEKNEQISFYYLSKRL